MLSTLVLISMLAGVAAQPTPASFEAGFGNAPSRSDQPELLAQRQPGGLPGMRDGDEESSGAARELPHKVKPAAPATRSVPAPKVQGRPDGATDADKKAAKDKKSPDGAK